MFSAKFCGKNFYQHWLKLEENEIFLLQWVEMGWSDMGVIYGQLLPKKKTGPISPEYVLEYCFLGQRLLKIGDFRDIKKVILITLSLPCKIISKRAKPPLASAPGV